MDGESSYESDISESWSLIDINLNEEPLSGAEASEVEKICQPDLKTEETQATKETELEVFVRKCKESNITDFNRISDSDSDTSAKNQELSNCEDTAEARGDISPCKRSSDTEELNDSAESIEILEVDDSDLGRFDVPDIGDFPPPISRSSYHSDDEESLEERIGNENRNNNLTVIRRRRKRVNRTSEETVHSVNSENRSSVESNPSICSSGFSDKESRQLIEETDKTDGHPVYKHCRNNVANTILSLSVGIIVTGVACIAIGHFLGVQDAAETTVELSEALKKLQVENAALQSRLSNLNRALQTREASSKIELPLDEPDHKAARESPRAAVPPETSKNPDINNAALSEIRSSLNKIEWLSKVEEYIHKTNKATDTEYGIDFSGFGKFLHDQLHILNSRQVNGAKFLEDTDKKISKVLHKIINRLSSSQDHIEKLYERLIKLKNKLNHKIKKIFPETSKSKPRGGIPVTERDLQTMSWHRDDEIMENSHEMNPEDIFYRFPQPESYYKKENDLKDTDEQELTNSTRVYKNKDSREERVVKRHKKKLRNANGKKEEKMHNKENWKKKKYKEKEAKEKKTEKRRKREAKKMHKMVKNSENGQKDRVRVDESRSKNNQNVFNQTIFQKKSHTKARSPDSLPKLKHKKLKGSKLGKILLTKLSKKPHYKKCPGPGCFNLTGNWVFKWAGGREEIRRNQALGDWQFDRAKARKELRDEYRENWQFKRALAREYNRNDARWREKYAKYVGKDFFEDFSWI